MQAEAVCEQYAGKVAAMEQRRAELDLLRGENMRQSDAIADLHRRLQAAEVPLSMISFCSPSFRQLTAHQCQGLFCCSARHRCVGIRANREWQLVRQIWALSMEEEYKTLS